MKLNAEVLKKIVQAVSDVQSAEIGCDTCFEHLDQFADCVLAGKPFEEAMLLVQDHLRHCPECQDEFAALLRAIKTVEPD